MGRLLDFYRLWIDSQRLFHLSGKRYMLGMDGARAYALLEEMANHTHAPDDGFWLLPFRHRIREVEGIHIGAAIAHVVDHTKHSRLRSLAIWLRGRCRGTLGTDVVARFASSSDPALRKEVVRALKRLSAWNELRQIEENDPDPRIRRLASIPSLESYAQRMGAFCHHVARQAVTPGKQELVIASGIDFQHGRPAKSTWWIRQILERIHRLVRGTAH